VRAFGCNVGMCICNDRRWPESYRVMALQGADLILIGYNTPVGLGDPYELDALAPFHNHLCMQAGAYQNAAWVVGVAKCGREEGYDMIGQSAIIAPSGEIVAMCRTHADELVTYRLDLDAAAPYRADIFNFAAHRRTEAYGLIVERTGPVPPQRQG
jgi:predicted amidohydrolase